MNILVCVKQVNGELNPFDASAVEAALRIPGGNVTVLSMGRPDVADMLRGLTRLGVERAVLLTDVAFAGADTLATAYTLSLAAKRLKPDILFCGRQSVDGDTAQVGPMLAAMLSLPVVTNVMELEADKTMARCVTRGEKESVPLPCVITLERIHVLRFPRIGSKPGGVEIWDAADLNANISRCGLKGSPTRVLKTYECTAGRRQCRFVPLEELDAEIDAALTRPKVQMKPKRSSKKLPEIWCVGREMVEMAVEIADRVEILDPAPAERLAQLIRQSDPAAVLWPADAWGRKTAPQVAALLQTGLCADCTALETDGEQLYMIRPAMGGSIMARIVCRTRPAMATVRCAKDAADGVVVAVGAGAAEQLAEIREWAKRRGYTMAASRTLVDQGLVPYDWQVGLTGKTLAPAVYIAVGISGAVQHTCAIEGAGTIIAVNPDKKARIFSYADIGVVKKWSCSYS